MQTPLLRFRPPVVILRPVAVELCRLARNGYETPHKREAFGFLYGTLSRQGRLEIRRALEYRGGQQTRTGVRFRSRSCVARAVQRREQHARSCGMRFLGGFHSHVEIAGRVCRGLSLDDRRSLSGDHRAAVEALVMTWAGGRPGTGGPGAVFVYEMSTGYSYRIWLYAKRPQGIRRTRVLVGGARPPTRTGETAHSLLLP